MVPTLKELVIRYYDKNKKLLNESTLDNETKKIDHELAYEYDAIGNLISKKEFFDDELERSESNYYDHKNKLVKQIIIEQKLDGLLNVNVDSMIKTKSFPSLPSPTYDTIISIFNYDINGKLIESKRETIMI